ncbi:hypothetical protein C2G38_2192254 [Gigaspora rosea]|uniref:F-box domain-containing protein n=1 Tax=Gigaspora rosea TaxID=44941 RepID=A0A397V0I0_9GLOM|nr:hypothetical protein C2G38_2192254 [Gigaspora rosea]
MSIPILWQDPFSIERRSLFIPIYFSSLDEDEKLVIKECLKEFGINIEFSKPLFDYARFLKVLYIYRLRNKIREWMCLKFNTQNLLDYNSNIFPLITLLFKLFHESGAILHELGIHNSEFLKFELDESLHSLKQNQLRKFILNGNDDCLTEFYGIISALESQKDTLQEVTLEDCFFSTEFEVLNNFKNLETHRILDCDIELLKILDHNISTLEISYCQINVLIIVQILEKVGKLLQRLKIETGIVVREETLLLEALKSFCPNIIYLYITDIELSTQLLEPIGNLQKLQFLSLWYAYHTPKKERKYGLCNLLKYCRQHCNILTSV